MRNYSIYTLKTKLEFTNLYQNLSEKDYKQLSFCVAMHIKNWSSGLILIIISLRRNRI